MCTHPYYCPTYELTIALPYFDKKINRKHLPNRFFTRLGHFIQKYIFLDLALPLEINLSCKTYMVGHLGNNNKSTTHLSRLVDGCGGRTWRVMSNCVFASKAGCCQRHGCVLRSGNTKSLLENMSLLLLVCISYVANLFY